MLSLLLLVEAILKAKLHPNREVLLYSPLFFLCHLGGGGLSGCFVLTGTHTHSDHYGSPLEVLTMDKLLRS